MIIKIGTTSSFIIKTIVRIADSNTYLGIFQFGRMRDLGSRGWEFKSLYPDQYASVAQLAERFTCNEDVVGSSPIGSSKMGL